MMSRSFVARAFARPAPCAHRAAALCVDRRHSSTLRAPESAEQPRHQALPKEPMQEFAVTGQGRPWCLAPPPPPTRPPLGVRLASNLPALSRHTPRGRI